jgi:dienelactone hydrolase
MDDFPTFHLLHARIQALYADGDYGAALELATEGSANFPEQFPLLYYWQICMAARTGQPELALSRLDELLERNFWYSETLLRKSPSLLPFQGQVEFEKRVQRCQKLQDQEEARQYPLLVLRSNGRCAAGEAPCPLLIALHANASTAQASVEFWQAAAAAGWLVAIPQSTQAMWKGAYVWDDRALTEQELVRHFHSLLDRYAIDPERVVIAGHSMGGEMAVWLAVKNILPVQGFIAVGPGGPLMDEVENWTAVLKLDPNQVLRGYLIFGQEDDTINQENIHTLAKILNQAGIDTELEEIPGASHDFAEEYADSLLRGLDYLIAE